MKTTWKTINKTALVVGIMGVAAACTKLDDNVYSTLVADSYTYTENDLVRILGTAYTPWRGAATGAINESQEMAADAQFAPVHPWGWNGTTMNMHWHTWTSETGEAVNRWGNLYQGVNNANQVLFQIESGLIPIESGKEALIAELKVLRASYYYLLCDYYGNVPYVTRFDVEPGFLPDQLPRAALYDSIVNEVTAALPHLTDRVDNTTYGRFTKWGALALLAKMYINAEVYTETPQWEACLAACEQIIESGKFALAANQKDIFSPNNAHSPEAVFAVPFDQSYASGLNVFNYTLNGQFSRVYDTRNFGGWGGTVAIPQFIETFDEDDSRLTDNYLFGQQYYPDGSMVLCELGESQGQPLNLVNAVPGLAWAEEFHGFKLAKYAYEPGMSPNAMSNHVLPFRYTDVLMMKAECLLRLNRADEAAEIVTEVRERAFRKAPEKARVAGSELLGGSRYDYGLRETNFSNRLTDARVTHEGGADIPYGRFLDELGWEFNQEGRRRQDLIRFGVWTTKSWMSHKATFDKDKILYPIPRVARETNPKLDQNHGY